MSEPRNSSNSGSTVPKLGVVMDVQEANAQYLLAAERQIAEGYKQTEVGVIPEDWDVVDYVSIGQVIDGDRGVHYPSAGELNNSGDCLFLNAGNVTKTGFRFTDCQFISREKDKKLNKGKLDLGDVVLTTRGTLGNFAYFSREIPFDEMRINSGMVILRNTSTGIDTEYQYLVLKSSIVESQIERISFGSAQPQLTVKGISSLKFPLPPTKAEQEAIAEALSDADALIEALEQLITKKRQLKQGAMQELLTGKRRLPGFSGEWELKPLGEIGESIIGLTYSPNDVRADGVLVLRSSNVQEGALSFQDNVYVELEISERIMVRTGDILICVRNGSRDLIGKCAKIDDRCKGMTFGAFMSVFRTPFHNFFFHQFQSNVIKRQINEHLGATINQITNKSLNSFQIPFPKSSPTWTPKSPSWKAN